MTSRPRCYPEPHSALLASGGQGNLPLLDVLTSPVPNGRFDSPLDDRHVLCLHLGEPVPVSYRSGRVERQGTRLHGQFCVVPAGSSTCWTLSRPAKSLLLRLVPSVLKDATEDNDIGSQQGELVPAVHIRDPQIEGIGWLMKEEERLGFPGGHLFSDSLATALAVRLVSLQVCRNSKSQGRSHPLPEWLLRRVTEYIEENLDRDLRLGELAAVAGFSVSHFTALFRQATGLSAHRFVMERRVQRARIRLIEGNMSLMEIAIETGFSHPSHMARWMRRVLGMSPSQLAASRH